MNWNDPLLAAAVLVWTGYGEANAPRRDKSFVQHRFGDDAAKWMGIVDVLADEFYESNANLRAVDMHGMWDMSIADFREKYPDVPEAVVKALAWCYTFDNR
jgi:hypothetical protein